MLTYVENDLARARIVARKKKRHHRSSLFTHFSRLFSFAGCLFSACNDTSYGHKDICVVHACVYRGGVRVHVRV